MRKMLAEEKLWKEEGIILMRGRNFAPIFVKKTKLYTFSNNDLKSLLLIALDELAILRYRRGVSWLQDDELCCSPYVDEENYDELMKETWDYEDKPPKNITYAVDQVKQDRTPRGD